MPTRRTIRNCSTVFRLVCPKRWEELTPTDEPTVRHCGQCDQRVYLCESDDETIAHAKAGRCIAREFPDESDLPRVYLGQPVDRSPPRPEQTRAALWRQREMAVDDAIKNAHHSTRCCPRCGYPAPDWRVSCRVCGFEFGRVPSTGVPDS